MSNERPNKPKRSDAERSAGKPIPRRMPSGRMSPESLEGQVRVLVEIDLPDGGFSASRLDLPGIELDRSFRPVQLKTSTDPRLGVSTRPSIVIRGTIPSERIVDLERQPNVIKVWKDTPIAPFAISVRVRRAKNASLGTSVSSSDCDNTVAKGNLSDVARYLGADQLWEQGLNGDGIVVGVVDGGITSLDRQPRPGESASIPNVTNGWPSDWGTTSSGWEQHGNMVATDILGISRHVELYDLRISDGDFISNALGAYDWALSEYKKSGRPHVLTNSWGIYQESWDPGYARDHNHPFTRKVQEAIDEGLICIFAAGNCGSECPPEMCGDDIGPGRSIWGANGLPSVITVGACNINEVLAGYSSEGPSTLSNDKPDICGITHFKGYKDSDDGTSAACPIVAGVVALIKQAKTDIRQEDIKKLLRETAKPIGSEGWNAKAGSGVIQAQAAYTKLNASASATPLDKWRRLEGIYSYGAALVSKMANSVDCFAIGNNRSLIHAVNEDDKWSMWTNLGGICFSAPSAVSLNPNTVEVFVIGKRSCIYRKRYDGQWWSHWENLGGLCIRGVSVTSSAQGRIDCFTVGTDGHVYERHTIGQNWSEWTDLGGSSLSPPAAVSRTMASIDLCIVGTDSHIYHRILENDQWSDWSQVRGTYIYGIGLTSPNRNGVDCLAVGIDSSVYQLRLREHSWGEPKRLESTVMSSVACASREDEKLDICVIGDDGALYHQSVDTSSSDI
jgi:serine protease AprX